jgi:hypothetical protein
MFSSGFEFTGTWKHNKRHGHGIEKSPNGDKYEAEWIEGEAITGKVSVVISMAYDCIGDSVATL